MPVKKLQHHLVKCRERHDMNKYKLCPFDGTHYILNDLFEEHVIDCPSRKVPTLQLHASMLIAIAVDCSRNYRELWHWSSSPHQRAAGRPHGVL